MAALLITLLGSGAALLIIRVANANTYQFLNYESDAPASLGDIPKK